MAHRATKLIPDPFTAVPSERARPAVTVRDDLDAAHDLDALGVVVHSDRPVPPQLGLPREALERAGFEGKVGTSLLLPARDLLRVAVGGGRLAEQSATTLRDAAGALGRATPRAQRLGLDLPHLGDVAADAAAQALVEGALLARYRYSVLQREPVDRPLTDLVLGLEGAGHEAAEEGAAAGARAAHATAVARDLANTPAGHLTATDLADAAVELGRAHGFEVEVFDQAALVEMGCGGLLGVNRGSVEEARLVRLRHAPDGADAHLALVGKGITYDSGGISLKPSDPMHLLMKMDMGGAAAILGAFTGLRAAGVACRVTGFLACTDNMPSGGAYVLGDVLHTRGGRTVEVRNTDAEGRLAMSDALVLAAEEDPGAIVTVATLTGAALAALGPAMAVTLGTDQRLVDRVLAAAEATAERAWQLPLERSYRPQLDSAVADIANLGGAHAGSITAGLFLAEFVGDVPWAHLDIAGTMQSESDDGWRPRGATGYGARLLLELARRFGSDGADGSDGPDGADGAATGRA